MCLRKRERVPSNLRHRLTKPRTTSRERSDGQFDRRIRSLHPEIPLNPARWADIESEIDRI